jgi:hypothetical protein
MTPEFNAWWNEGETTTDNPYEAGSPAFWAWEGWQAGVKSEREQCAQLVENYAENQKLRGILLRHIATYCVDDDAWDPRAEAYAILERELKS